jgi:transposase-like protein
MYSHVPACPHCQKSACVVRFGYNRSGTYRCQCEDCDKTFTPEPRSNRLSPEKEELIERALEERLSIEAIEAIARLFQVAKKTVYKILKKRQQTTAACADAG